jgi:glycosyltransferase involved in cell wall biosynthesis
MTSITPPNVSVIVPFYNCEDFIEECVVSLMKQTLSSIEYIFIDDSSTDDGVSVLNKTLGRFPERGGQWRIIKHEKNLGISASRQEGLREAAGKWIIYCDADDKVDNAAYEKMFLKGERDGFDIIGCSYEVFGDVPAAFIENEGEGEVDPMYVISAMGGSVSRCMTGALWNKMIRREFYEGVLFPEKVNYCEDVVAMFQVFAKNPKVYYLPDPLYYYRMRGNSLIKTSQQRMNEQCQLIIPVLERMIPQSQTSVQEALKAKIVALIYRSIRFSPNETELLVNTYGKYGEMIDSNHRLKASQKLHFRLLLKGWYGIAGCVNVFNESCYGIIKLLRKLKLS